MSKRYEPFFLKEDERIYLSLFQEKTYNIQQDIEKLYKLSGFDEIAQLVVNDRIKDLPIDLQEDIKNRRVATLYSTTTNVLTSRDCQDANKIKAVPIHFIIDPQGSRYSANSKEDLIADNMQISVSLNHSALRFLVLNQNKSRSMLKRGMKISQYEYVFNVLSPQAIKSSIAHELTHWLQDVLHNRFLYKLFLKSHELNNENIITLKLADVNMTHFEIDAMVNALKNTKESNQTDWDSLTLTDLIFRESVLQATVSRLHSLYSDKIISIWLEFLIKRMSRENLLGKNMRETPDIKKLTESGWMGLDEKVYQIF